MGKPEEYLGKGRCGWIMALGEDPGSAWGIIDEFYENMEGEAIKEGVFTVSTGDWVGTLRGKGHLPVTGDGIAFYHNTRSKLSMDSSGRVTPRISLMGRLTGFRWQGAKLNHVEARCHEDVLAALMKSPIMRQGSNKELFAISGPFSGTPATYYYVPPEVWQYFVNKALSRLRS